MTPNSGSTSDHRQMPSFEQYTHQLIVEKVRCKHDLMKICSHSSLCARRIFFLSYLLEVRKAKIKDIAKDSDVVAVNLLCEGVEIAQRKVETIYKEMKMFGKALGDQMVALA